jgi:hypothetical protein
MLFKIAFLINFVGKVQAIGRAIVTNQCDQPIYLWSVGGSVGQQVTIDRDSSYSETFRSDPASGGIALKIAAVEGGLLRPNASQTIFAFNLDTADVWYDMNNIFGNAFIGRKISITPTDTSCQDIVWGDGKPPAGSQVKKCQANTDLEMTFCTGRCLPAWCK